MKRQQLIQTYNQPGNLLVVTNYPPRGRGAHTAKIGGVAGYAKHSLVPLAEQFARDGRKIIVLADILDRPALYEEDGMLIIRAWKRNTPQSYLHLLGWLINFWRVGDIFVEFEFASLGNFLTTSLFPVFLAILRLTGKRITIALHQVVTDLWSLIGHIGLHFDSREFKLFSALLPVYYFLLTHLAHQIIVLEDEFKKRLAKIAPEGRVIVIPHGIQPATKLLTKKRSRKMLGLDPDEYIITAFGFITWYKGTDTIVELLADPIRVNGKRVRLIVAGGESTTQKEKEHYQKYYASVMEMARGKSHITVTGFVPDTNISAYMAASDVVVFPYRTAMSSSGPLAVALGHKKPVLVSSALTTLLHSSDYKTAFKDTHFSPRALLLPATPARLAKRLEAMAKPSYKRRIRRFIDAMHQKRSFTNMARTYYTVFAPKETVLNAYRLLTAFR